MIFKSQFLSYIVFAVITSLINVLSYLVCYEFIYANIIFSNVIAYTLSISTQFIVNKKVVFKNNNGNVVAQILLFLATKLLAFLIDSIVLIGCFKYLHLSNFISKIIANCSTTLTNYTLNKKIVFK